MQIELDTKQDMWELLERVDIILEDGGKPESIDYYRKSKRIIDYYRKSKRIVVRISEGVRECS